MYNINKNIADGNYTREQAASGDNAQVTSDLSYIIEMVKLAMMIMVMKSMMALMVHVSRQ